MISIRSARITLLILAPMLMSSSATARSRSRQYNLVPATASTRFLTAFVNRRYSTLLLLRGGGNDDGPEKDERGSSDINSNSDSVSQPQDKDGKNNKEGEKGEDAWKEVIRNTREYYYSASQTSKSSFSSTFGSTLIASQASPTDAITCIDNEEDGRVFGNSHSVCDNNSEHDNGQGGKDNGDGGNYLTSTTIIEKVKESDITNNYEEDDDLSTIHDDDDVNGANNIDDMKEGKETHVGQIYLEDVFVQNAGDVTNVSEEIEITIQETAAYNGIASNQVENNKSTKDRNDSDDDSEGIMNDSDKSLPAIYSEVGKAAVNHELQAVEVGKQADKTFAAEEEGQIRRFDPELRVTEVINEILAGDKEQDELAQNDNDDKILVDSLGSNHDSIKEGKEVKGTTVNDKFKGVALRVFCSIQRRISTLMMICRRKEVRPIILTLMGVAISLLLNSARVSEKSMNVAQAFESQSNYDVEEDLPNTEENEDSVVTTPSTPQ